MKKENLVCDHIGDFKPGQSIYIQITESRDFPVIFECEFIRFDNKNIVHGKVVGTDTNPGTYKHKIDMGWVIRARITKCSLWGQLPNADRTMTHWFDVTGYAAYETVDKLEELVPKKHESYGTINLSRGSSSHPRPLFGSSIKHSNTITLTISKAELDRDLSTDWIHSYEELIEVEMSESQFAQAITLFNQGDGTPVTIKHVNRKQMKNCPYVSKVEQYGKEFEQDMKELVHDLQSTMKKAKEILTSGKAPNKGERDLVLNAIEGLTSKISGKLPFVADQFAEQMDKTVMEAKKEIEVFIRDEAKRQGLKEGTVTKLIEIE